MASERIPGLIAISVHGASRLQSRKALRKPSSPSVNRARSRRVASVLRTHAPAAALHAQRSTPKGVSRRNSPAAARLQNGEGAALAARTGRLDRLDAGPDGLRPRPQLSPASCPCSGPRRASAAGAQQPRRAHALSLWLSGEAPAPRAGLPSLPNACHTPERAPKTKRRKPGAVAAALAAAATPQAHTATSEAAPDRRAASPLTAQPYPTAPSTHLAAVRLALGFTDRYREFGIQKSRVWG